MCSTVSQRAPTLWRPTENWKTQTPIWISPSRCYWETPQFRKPSEHQNIIFWRVQPSVFRSVYNTSCFKHTHKIFTCWGCFPLHFWSNLWPRTSMVSSPRRRRNRLQKPRSQKWLHRLRRRRLQKPRSQKWLQFVASENLHFFQTELPWIAHGLHHFYPFFWQQIVGPLHSGDSSVISTRVRSVQGLSNLEFCAVLDWNFHGKRPRGSWGLPNVLLLEHGSPLLPRRRHFCKRKVGSSRHGPYPWEWYIYLYIIIHTVTYVYIYIHTYIH